jgi:hypothetical protein
MKKMSQLETQQIRKGVATRTALLLIIIAGLSAGAAAFAFANVSANSGNQTGTNNLTTNQWSGLRAGPRDIDGSFTGFRAASTIANVSVTGFNIVDSSHITVTMTWRGTGAAPSVTIVASAYDLSGSNTVATGWTSPDTVSVHLVGTGTLSSNVNSIRVLVVPLTGA